jgi:hypothetical protein
MSAPRTRAHELAVAASPIWIQLRDTFTGTAPRGPVGVRLERSAGTSWVEFDHPAQISSAGQLGFVNLGRSRNRAGKALAVRIHVTAPGSIAETPDGDPAITATIPAWGWGPAPPAPPAPTDLLLYPAPAYAFPSRTPIVAGQVLDAHGDPAPGARVWATAKVQNTLLTEEVRSDGDGRFRLPVRWSVGATDVRSSHRGRAGSLTVVVPADLSSTHQITLT